MKKISITIGVVFCIFILCSLTYQPIVANESNNHIEKKNLNLIDKQIKINNFIDIYLKLKDKDCGCDDFDIYDYNFPIICYTLAWAFFISHVIYILTDEIGWRLCGVFYTIGKFLNCWWV